MKASQFNLFFPHDGFHVGYNGYTDAFIILEPMLYDMYDASKRSNSFEELKEVHSDFYNNLVENGFVVEETIDEVDRVKQASIKIDNDLSRFELHINPTMNCNFKCWYCYETHIKDSKMDTNTIEHTKKFISRVLETQTGLKEFSLGWFGGEPLLYFKKVMVPILQYAYPACIERNVSFSSHMTSNGLLIDDEVIELCKEYNLHFFQITLDGNRERHDKVRFISEGKGSYDRIVANMKKLAENGLTVVARINISPETLFGVDDVLLDFSDLSAEVKKFIRFDLHKVWQIEEDIDDAINDKRIYFRSHGFKVTSGTHETVVNSCYGDHRNHATLNYNGEVFKCTARDFTHANSEGVLNENGEIIWGPKYEKRLNSKFKNKPCLECAILPICGGGCTQQALENEGRDYCVNDFDENKKLQLVKNKFFEFLEELEVS
jgi:uncharacterized protein